MLTHRQQAGAELERLLLLSRRVGSVQSSCLCTKTRWSFVSHERAGLEKQKHAATEESTRY